MKYSGMETQWEKITRTVRTKLRTKPISEQIGIQSGFSEKLIFQLRFHRVGFSFILATRDESQSYLVIYVAFRSTSPHEMSANVQITIRKRLLEESCFVIR